jgi:hypothetical protein
MYFSKEISFFHKNFKTSFGDKTTAIKYRSPDCRKNEDLPLDVGFRL